MATFTLQSLPNSFIQFNRGKDVQVADDEVDPGSGYTGGRGDTCIDCEDEPEWCLPINEITDIAFQWVLDGVTEEKSADFAIGLLQGCDCTFYGEVTDADFLETWNINYTAIGNNIYAGIFMPTESLGLCDLLDSGELLKLVLYDISQNYAVACTNCFRFFPDRCFTNLIRYNNPSNAFGFYYEEAGTSFYNKVRLGMHMHSPKWPERSKVYTDGIGVTRKLSSRILEQYVISVDYMTEHLHKCMAMALGHSKVQLYHEIDAAWKTKVFNEGEVYEPEWQNTPGHYTRTGPAEFNFITTPFDNQNNNC